MALQDLFRSREIDKEVIQQLHALSTVPGEVQARAPAAEQGQPGQDVFGREVSPPMEAEGSRLEVGPYVSPSPAGEYRAERYGYICLSGDRLSVFSPLWIDAGSMHVYWVVLDEHPQPVTPEMIQQCLTDLEVVEGVQGEKIERLAEALQEGTHKRGLFLIAAGTEPVNGKDAQIEILVDMAGRAQSGRTVPSIFAK